MEGLEDSEKKIIRCICKDSYFGSSLSAITTTVSLFPSVVRVDDNELEMLGNLEVLAQFKEHSWNSSGDHEENTRKTSGYLILWLRLEPGASRIQSGNVISEPNFAMSLVSYNMLHHLACLLVTVL